MATKDDRPTLLSKVALFVRNPTKDWSELETLDSIAPSGYDRAALKAAIERKRQNDFVRRREFDQLRKLRKSAAAGEVAQVRPSTFQTSSILTDPDGRAQTLEKIDQIEAQMSQQWWKGRTQPGAPDSAHDSDSHPTMQVASTQIPATNFPSTEALDTGAPEEDFATTQSTHDDADAGQHLPTPLDFDALVEPAHAAPLPPRSLPTDPELEEAAIRFANGDDAGAQGVLLQALRSAPHTDATTVHSWWDALLDAYRATDDRAGFDAAVGEFGPRFAPATPAWDASTRLALPEPGGEPPLSVPGGSFLWASPRRLGEADLERLRQVLAQMPMPWRLDWSALGEVEPSAQPMLGALFASLCNEPVQVHFTGVGALQRALQALTPPTEHEHALWALRLDALRVTQSVAEFERAALDYCIAVGVTPPPWMEARCGFENLDMHNPNGAVLTPQEHLAPTAPMSLAPPVQAPDARLQGQLSGDASAFLAHLVVGNSPQRRVVVIDCAELVRVDFSAAGSLLNWAAHQQALGATVEFRDVHRLVAAFFNVIGVHEHAHLLVRAL